MATNAQQFDADIIHAHSIESAYSMRQVTSNLGCKFLDRPVQKLCGQRIYQRACGGAPVRFFDGESAGRAKTMKGQNASQFLGVSILSDIPI
jgi:hypothetical protein